MQHHPVRVNSEKTCERCNNTIERGQRCFYYTVCWKGITKKAYCHKGCKKKER